ncbi:MAG: M48 family metallopeptidase, partial [Bacteroidota bacterium]
MKRAYIVIALVAFLLVDCARVPITGRRQVNLLPESQLMDMSLTSYKQFLTENKTVSNSDKNTRMVQEVGNRIANAVESYLKRHGAGSRISGYKWEFNLVDDPTVNAWAMPGGKVVVYSGLLPVAEDEAGLAVVMGHEVAHAIARHGNERMSQMMLTQMGGIALAVAVKDKPSQTQDMFLASYGLGSTLGTLKFSRDHEAEADRMGLTFMAMAGYDPDRAVGFWQRMSQAGGQKPPEFLSTHPSDDTRIRNIQKYLPEAR